MLYGKLIPFDVNAKVEEKTIVHYETLEERRAAMIAKGWAPAAVAALEEAMEPKFLRDMREESMREENEGQGEANSVSPPAVAEGHPADAVIEMWRPNTDAWALRGHLHSVAATIRCQRCPGIFTCSGSRRSPSATGWPDDARSRRTSTKIAPVFHSSSARAVVTTRAVPSEGSPQGSPCAGRALM